MTTTEAELVEGDALLMHRYLALFVVAEEVRTPEAPPTQLIMEQPEDPARYREPSDVKLRGYMSVFRTPTWKRFQELYGILSFKSTAIKVMLDESQLRLLPTWSPCDAA